MDGLHHQGWSCPEVLWRIIRCEVSASWWALSGYCFFLCVCACPGFPEYKLIPWSEVVILTQKSVGYTFFYFLMGRQGGEWHRMRHTYLLLESQLSLNIFFSCGFSCFLMCFTVKPDVSQQCRGQQISVCLARRYSEELEAVSVSRSLLRNCSSMCKRAGKSAAAKVCTDMICRRGVSQQFSNFLCHLWSRGNSRTAECHGSLYST